MFVCWNVAYVEAVSWEVTEAAQGGAHEVACLVRPRLGPSPAPIRATATGRGTKLRHQCLTAHSAAPGLSLTDPAPVHCADVVRPVRIQKALQRKLQVQGAAALVTMQWAEL